MIEPKARRHVLEEHLRGSDLPPLSRLVWHVIAGYGTAKTGDVLAYPPSLAAIAQASGLGRRAVVNHVNALVKEGWLHRDPGGPKRKTRYRLSSPMDPSPPLVHGGALGSVSTGEPGCTTVVHADALPSEPGCTKVVHGGAHDPGSPESPGNPSSARSPNVAYIAALTGADDDEASWIIEQVNSRHQPRSAGAYLRGMDAADLAELLAERRANATPPKPAWCGECDERTRQVQLESGYGEGVKIRRCPQCHPLGTLRR